MVDDDADDDAPASPPPPPPPFDASVAIARRGARDDVETSGAVDAHVARRSDRASSVAPRR
jgi:hypothetical protein